MRSFDKTNYIHFHCGLNSVGYSKTKHSLFISAEHFKTVNDCMNNLLSIECMNRRQFENLILKQYAYIDFTI